MDDVRYGLPETFTFSANATCGHILLAPPSSSLIPSTNQRARKLKSNLYNDSPKKSRQDPTMKLA